VPSAYMQATLEGLDRQAFRNRRIVSAIKGILPDHNLLLNEWLEKEFDCSPDDYFTVMGPCHAEEVAAEKLSYLTFSGRSDEATREIATCFTTEYINTVINRDV